MPCWRSISWHLSNLFLGFSFFIIRSIGVLNNVNEIPTLDKIIINIGDGKAATDGRALESMIDELTAISGQKPVIRRAKKSIAGFKIREGMPIGVAVTLRGDRMWEFYDRFVQVVVPRIRDFRGFNKKSFDGNGNYTLGLNEQLVFPEVEYDKVRDIRGMNITCLLYTSPSPRDS